MARALLALAAAALVAADPMPTPSAAPWTTASIGTSGVLPWLTMAADWAPSNSTIKRSENGIGAMMAWADRLYAISYLSVPDAGAGATFVEIDQNMQMTILANHTSCYANRMMIPSMDSIVIGPYIVDKYRNVRVLPDMLLVRLGAMAEHVSDNTRVYMLSMDGPLFDCSLVDLTCTQIYNMTDALDIPASSGEQPHFKALYTDQAGRVWIGSNTFEQADALGTQHGGRLAYWNGVVGSAWTIVERTAFVEIAGRKNMGATVFAMGWDDASVILKVVDVGNGANSTDPSYDTSIQTYRLPKASHAYDHLWTTEWPRIREVESERFLVDMHGMFFELAPFTWGGAAWGIKPISQHLRMIPDFASFRGFLVLGGNQVSSIFDNNIVTGQSQAGFWWGKTDDLWSFGKPQGWGGPWRYDVVPAATPSDAFLMTGFDKKGLHLRAEASINGVSQREALGAGSVNVTIQIDFTGSAGHRGAYDYMEPWNDLATVSVPIGGYAFYPFPTGFSAHWVRFVTDAQCNCTAWMTYT